jgi:hypothetical protein
MKTTKQIPVRKVDTYENLDRYLAIKHINPPNGVACLTKSEVRCLVQVALGDGSEIEHLIYPGWVCDSRVAKIHNLRRYLATRNAKRVASEAFLGLVKCGWLTNKVN